MAIALGPALEPVEKTVLNRFGAIGLLLVKEKNHTVAKYALAGNTKPIGVAEWEQQITQSLPEDLKPSLPSIEEIENEMDQESEQ